MEQFIRDIWAVICSIVGVAMFAAIIGGTAGLVFGIISRIFV